MSGSIQIRPKYKTVTNVSPSKIAEEITSFINQSKEINGRVINYNAYLKFSPEEAKYWSPEINVRIRPNGSGSVIKGVAGPNSKIWATFMVFYGLSVMLFIFGGLLGISGKMLGIDSFWVLSVPGSVVLFALVFLASKFGEKLGAEQLEKLRSFLDAAVESAESKHS